MDISDPTLRAWLQSGIELFTVKSRAPFIYGQVPGLYFTVKSFTSMREFMGPKCRSVRKQGGHWRHWRHSDVFTVKTRGVAHHFERLPRTALEHAQRPFGIGGPTGLTVVH
jgi:hypothetical protein